MNKFLLMLKYWILSLTKKLFNSKRKSPFTNFMDIDGVLNFDSQEPIIISKKSRSGTTVQQHIILVTGTPHRHSMAAGVLLNNELRLQDVDFLEENHLNTWLEFRERYLMKQLQLHGDLVCTYCGKPHLEIGGRTKKDLIQNNKNPNLATVDHIVALAKGGERYNEENLCVSCKDCNKKKGTKSVKEFMKNKILQKL
jgi:hypothetical protein